MSVDIISVHNEDGKFSCQIIFSSLEKQEK